MGGFKDKDLMADDCGKTKSRQYGQHQRPPRMQQRKNQRKRYLNKDEKRDMSAQELDFKLNNDGQVFVQQQPSNNQIMTFKDIVHMPQQVQDIHEITNDYNVNLQKSLNDIGGGFDVSVNPQQNQKQVDFDFVDTNIPQQKQQADVSNDDLILSQQDEQQNQQDSNPFDSLFDQDDKEEQTEEVQEQKTQQDDKEEQTEEVQEQKTQQDDKEEQTNDSIDQYLKMEIDDSKLSQQNKQKLDAFTDQQLDAFKKFLYQKKNQQ